MDAVGDQLNLAVLAGQRRAGEPGSAGAERRHRVEQVGDRGGARDERAFHILGVGLAVAERNHNSRARCTARSARPLPGAPEPASPCSPGRRRAAVAAGRRRAGAGARPGARRRARGDRNGPSRCTPTIAASSLEASGSEAIRPQRGDHLVLGSCDHGRLVGADAVTPQRRPERFELIVVGREHVHARVAVDLGVEQTGDRDPAGSRPGRRFHHPASISPSLIRDIAVDEPAVDERGGDPEPLRRAGNAAVNAERGRERPSQSSPLASNSASAGPRSTSPNSVSPANQSAGQSER